MSDYPFDVGPGLPHDIITALAIVQAAPEGDFWPKFDQWLTDNWTIWRAFEREADRAWNMGRTHHSARDLWGFLRHHTALSERRGHFKLNNNWTPSVARLYIALHPGREKFFELRSSNNQQVI